LEQTWKLSELESVPLSPLPSDGLCLDLQEDRAVDQEVEDQEEEEDPQQDLREDHIFLRDT
jgi:hypothetical protein